MGWWFAFFIEETTMSVKTAEKAMYHFYFVTEVIRTIPENQCIGDLFGIGEDCFVIELYPFSNLFYRKVDEAYRNGHEFSGCAVYEIVKPLAEYFWEQIERQELKPLEVSLPDKDEFELDLNRVIEMFCK